MHYATWKNIASLSNSAYCLLQFILVKSDGQGNGEVG